jgi:hypothetical protein
MTQTTTNYDQFKLREDNRPIDQAHLRKLKLSIASRNLLELRPIIVNEDLEVMDGQHRLEAARQLGLDIYYTVEKKLVNTDMILMNINKSWVTADFMHYYVTNGNDEYIKLKRFMERTGLNLKISLLLTMGGTNDAHFAFKNGEYKFNDEGLEECIGLCWDTIEYIKRMIPNSVWTASAKFWRPLVKLVRHEDFSMSKWEKNLRLNIDRFGPKARESDFLNMMQDIYNWKNRDKIDLECVA